MSIQDIYSVASGQAIYAGMSAPSGGADPSAWMPTAGQRTSVSLNTISAVYPVNAPDTRTRGSTAILESWNSTTYVPTLGSLGSIIAWGGGHGDYLGNEVYRYDIATRLWSRILEPFDIPVSYAIGTQSTDPNDGNGVGTGVSDLTRGEYWSDDTKSSTVVGQKNATHTYACSAWVEPAAAGNTNGWFVMVGNFNYQAHKIDLDNPSAGWSRFGPLLNSTGKVEVPSYGAAVYDGIRHRVMCYPFNNGMQPYAYALDVPTGSLATPAADYVDSSEAVMFHDITDDVFVMMRAANPSTVFRVIDPVAGTKYSPATSGTPPTDAHGSVGWIESTRQMYWWDGVGSTVYFLTAPANPKTGTWVWSSRTFAGDAPVGNISSTIALYRRLHYIPALNALIHVGRTTGPVQCWKL